MMAIRASVSATLLAALWASSVGAQTVSGTFKVVCLANGAIVDVTGRRACLSGTPRLSFKDELTLAVEHAPDVTFDDAAEPNPADLVLFLDGKPLPGTKAQVGKSQVDQDDVTTTLLTFRLARDLSIATARANWKEILVASRHRPISVSTGLEGGPAARSSASIEFVAVRPERLTWWAILAVVFAIGFWYVAWRTGALRDKEPGSAVIAEPKDRAFSLGRMQMAFWTALTLLAYVYIWLLTGEYNATIPQSALGLMGVSLTAFGAGAAIDASKAAEATQKLTAVREKIAASPPGVPGLQDEERKLVASSTVAPTEGLATDIGTSAAGASLHRLQFILWTLVLGAIFVATVWTTIAMPDFDTTLLGLMGLSAGGYVALKLPEQKQ